MRFLYCTLFVILFPCLAFGQTASGIGGAPVFPQAGAMPDRAAPGETASFTTTGPAEIVVLPEVSQVVQLSNTAYNRFQCDDTIQDVLASEEKILNVQYEGNNAFIKFKYVIRGGKAVYAEKPLDLSIVCGGEIYSIIAVPRPLPSSPKIRLSSGKKKKIQANRSLFGGMPHEKKALHFIKLAYTDTVPDSFDSTRSNTRFDLFKGLGLVLVRVVVVPGEGLKLKEYEVSNDTKEALRLTEKKFMMTELTTRTVAIALSKLNLKPGETARLFVVEQTGGNREQDQR
jgi:conjugal transfer pilus assembly protein TraK